MTEEECKQQRQEEVIQQKEVEFYAQAVSAWFLTSLELDKSYLTISVTALGFWITLIATLKAGLFVSTFSVLFCVASLVAFAATCLLVLNIFHCNRQVILEIIHTPLGDSPRGPTNEKIKKLDGLVRWSFGSGVVMLGLFGLITADRFLDDRNGVMANSNDNNNPPIVINGPVMESFNNLQALRPQMNKSFGNAQQLRPQTTQSSQGTTQGQAPASGATSQGNTPTSTPANTGKK
jgi:hypothetical protein